MSAIISATAAVPPHARLSDADTIPLPVPVPEQTVEQRVSALLNDPDVPARYAAELRRRMRQILAEVDTAEYLAAGEKWLTEMRQRYSINAPAPIEGHPDWEADCIDGDSPLHVAQELTVTIPSGVRDKMTTLSVQVQQNDGEPADLWLDGHSVSADDAEAHAMNILAAAALARRINARDAGTEAAA